jgi:hypothetical protein
MLTIAITIYIPEKRRTAHATILRKAAISFAGDGQAIRDPCKNWAKERKWHLVTFAAEEKPKHHFYKKIYTFS